MRFFKQLGYGSLYLLIFTLIGSGIYWAYFYTIPTCFDNIQNQDELGVDCDGSCVACDIKNAVLSTTDVDVLHAGDGKITLLTKIDNPINYNATFEYKIDIFGSFGTPLHSIVGESSVNPNSGRYIVIPGVTFDKNDVSKATVEIINATWVENFDTEFFAVEIKNPETVITGNEAKVTGKVFNGSLDLVRRARVTVLLTNQQNEIISASAVDINNVGVSEEREFKVFFPSIEGLGLELAPIRTRIFSEIIPSL